MQKPEFHPLTPVVGIRLLRFRWLPYRCLWLVKQRLPNPASRHKRKPQGSLPKLKPIALPNFSANAGSTALPPVAVAAVPRPNELPSAPISAVPPSHSSLAEEIEVSGVVQVGGKWTIIVKEPGAPTSRYVSKGDYLANGRVFVKRIVPGADPVVILQQNGVEVTKSIGSSTGPIAHR